MNEDQDFNLGQQIAELRGIVVTGFSEMHKRQDTTNGRLLKAEADIQRIKESNAFKDGEKKGIRISWGVFIVIAAGMGTVLGLAVEIAKTIFNK